MIQLIALIVAPFIGILLGWLFCRNWEKKQYDVSISALCNDVDNLWTLTTEDKVDVESLKRQIEVLEEAAKPKCKTCGKSI